MDNPNQGNNERLILQAQLNAANEKEEHEGERLAGDDPLPENKKDRSEADKEAETRPEDFESFNVDKVDDLQENKEKPEK
ncbi:hypothetical protein [Atopococcus tabaci]|uniref:hypothetical protein n=1 Tax=Atopococcus tabaci TaxID=269774 RepID=UPI0004109B6C|nr:hypothetical protein [Atopococcus tabaci]